MRSVRFGLAAVLCLWGGLAFGQNTRNTQNTQPNTRGTTAPPARPAASNPRLLPGQLPADVIQPTGGQQAAQGQQGSSDQQIAALIYGVQNNEIEISKFAQNRLQSQEAKHFAEQMIKDHSDNIQHYKPLAGNLISHTDQAGQQNQRGMGHLDWVSIHQQMGQQCLKSDEEELGRQQAGADFDKGYMACQIAAHLGAKDKLTVLRQHASPELQQEIDKSLQAVNTHLSHARQIMEQLKDRPSERVSRKPESK
jgi:predicted outer membrane protein